MLKQAAALLLYCHSQSSWIKTCMTWSYWKISCPETRLNQNKSRSSMYLYGVPFQLPLFCSHYLIDFYSWLIKIPQKWCGNSDILDILLLLGLLWLPSYVCRLSEKSPPIQPSPQPLFLALGLPPEPCSIWDCTPGYHPCFLTAHEDQIWAVCSWANQGSGSSCNWQWELAPIIGKVRNVLS